MELKKFHSGTIPDSRLLQGILGLRGIAAFAIVLFHFCHIAGIPTPPELFFIKSHFGVGVIMFFVLSAFSLMYSTEHTMHRPNWVREYLTKRFFRIAPLYYFMLACMVVLLVRYALKTDAELPSISVVLLNVFFVFGFFQNPEVGLVMAGWSVGVEMIFYVLFPVLLMTITTARAALLFFLMAALISYVSKVELHALYLQTSPLPKWDASTFAFLPNLIFFAAGIYAYRLGQSWKLGGKTLHVLTPWVALFAIIVLPQFSPWPFGGFIQAIGFCALCIWQSTRPSLLFANRFMEYLGERSFSIYLLHPLVIVLTQKYIVGLYAMLEPALGTYAFIVCALLVVLVVLALAEITYRTIEVPGIKYGRKVIETMRGTAAQAR